MKTISFDFTERMRVIAILNSFKGTLADTAVVMNDLKSLQATDEEAKTVGLTTVQKGDVVSPQWQADAAASLVKDIELSAVSASSVQRWFDEKDKKGEFTISDVGFMSIRDKVR